MGRLNRWIFQWGTTTTKLTWRRLIGRRLLSALHISKRKFGSLSDVEDVNPDDPDVGDGFNDPEDGYFDENNIQYGADKMSEEDMHMRDGGGVSKHLNGKEPIVEPDIGIATQL